MDYMQSHRSEYSIMIARFRLKEYLIKLYNCFKFGWSDLNWIIRSVLNAWLHAIRILVKYVGIGFQIPCSRPVKFVVVIASRSNRSNNSDFKHDFMQYQTPIWGSGDPYLLQRPTIATWNLIYLVDREPYIHAFRNIHGRLIMIGQSKNVYLNFII
jgi:hypothetical protein